MFTAVLHRIFSGDGDREWLGDTYSENYQAGVRASHQDGLWCGTWSDFDFTRSIWKECASAPLWSLWWWSSQLTAHKQMMLQFSFKLKTKKVKNSNLIICSLHQKLLHNLAILNYFDMSRNIQSYHNFIRSKISAQRVSHFIFIFIFQILQHM